MASLEELIREACKRGLTHLTLYPVPSQDNKTLYWCARATPSTGHSYVQTQTLDPIEAMTEVLKALPKAPKRASKAADKPLLRDEVTAPVTETLADPDHVPDEPTPEPGDMNTWLPKA
jgi:hypothetical protein